MIKKSKLLYLAIGIFVVILSFCSCTEKKSVDDQFMDSLAKGLEARWTLTEKKEKQTDVYETKDDWSQYMKAESDQILGYMEQTFENKELGDLAKTYIQTIEDSKDALQYFGTDQWTSKYTNNIYQTRCATLYKINKLSPISVSEAKQDTLKGLLIDGEVSDMAQNLIANVSFELEEDLGGYKTYSVVVENTSKANFSFFQFYVALIDDSGVTLDTQIASVSEWNAGEKAKFSFGTAENFNKMEIKSAEWAF